MNRSFVCQSRVSSSKSNQWKLNAITSSTLQSKPALVQFGNCRVFHVATQHAISILLKLKKDPQFYVQPFFTIAALQEDL
jgi:hypothetical protein